MSSNAATVRSAQAISSANGATLASSLQTGTTTEIDGPIAPGIGLLMCLLHRWRKVASRNRDALPSRAPATRSGDWTCRSRNPFRAPHKDRAPPPGRTAIDVRRSEEHTSELQSLMRITYAV